MEQFGHGVDVVWLPPRTDRPARLLPAYRFRNGPGGVFHAFSSALEVDLGDTDDAVFRAAYVPHRKLAESWDEVVDGGAELRHWFGPQTGLSAGVDVASDALYALDVRGTAVLVVGVP